MSKLLFAGVAVGDKGREGPTSAKTGKLDNNSSCRSSSDDSEAEFLPGNLGNESVRGEGKAFEVKKDQDHRPDRKGSARLLQGALKKASTSKTSSGGGF